MGLPTMEDAIEELDLFVPRSRKVGCPKHEERTPSLHLYEDHWYCYACGRHGDGIGLIAAFTGQDVRRLVAERGGGHRDSTRLRMQTKGLNRRDVTVGVLKKYREIHAWFFRRLADTHGDSPEFVYLSAIDRWSEVFDDIRDWLVGEGMYMEDGAPAPFHAEKRLTQFHKELQAALEFEQKDARRVRL